MLALRYELVDSMAQLIEVRIKYNMIKYRFSLLLLFAILSVTPNAMAQDFAFPDTADFVVSVNPSANASEMHLQLDLYAYTDAVVKSVTMGWSWDNPNLQLDSAVASPAVVTAFDLGRFFFESGDIALTNANQRFLFGGARLFSSGLPPSSTRRLWASYFFTLSSWTLTDSIKIDTMEFNAGSIFKMVNENTQGYIPIWTGGEHVTDPDAPAPGAHFVISPDTLNFIALEGDANPAPKLFNVSSDGNQLDFTVVTHQSWLTATPNTATTPSDIEVAIDITSLTAGNYTDTLELLSTDTGFVIVNLGMIAPNPPPESITVVSPNGGENFVIGECTDIVWSQSVFAGAATIELSRDNGVSWETLGTSIPGDSNFSFCPITGPASQSCLIRVGDSVDGTPSDISDATFTIQVQAPVITCSGSPLAISICDSDSTICIDLPVSGADSVRIVGPGSPAWANGQLCFTRQSLLTSYPYTVIAENAGGADTCGLTVNVTVNTAPQIACPINPVIDILLPAPGDYCQPLSIIGADSVTLSGGSWSSDTLCFTADSAGSYAVQITATNGCGLSQCNLTFNVTFDICNQIVLSDTLFRFDAIFGSSAPLPTQTLAVTSSADPFCYTIDCDTDAVFLNLTPRIGCTLDSVIHTLIVDYAGMAPGLYSTTCWATGDSNMCDSQPSYFAVELNVVDTTTPQIPDTIVVSTVPAVPGMQVRVPVRFANGCDLSDLSASLSWNSNWLALDSVLLRDGRAGAFPTKQVNINHAQKTVQVQASSDGQTSPIPPGFGGLADMYFSVAVEAPAGFFPIRVDSTVADPVLFTEDCGQGSEQFVPFAIPGGIVVDTSGNYVCGYVVDTLGNSLPGATVLLYDEFPAIGPIDEILTNGAGAFAFTGFTAVPFDLYAYKDGYYPNYVTDLNFGQTGIVIVLSPMSPVVTTPEWVNFYCMDNLFMDVPLPVGSVIDAFDPDDVHCGSYWVDREGQYGFMPVYREDEFTPGDQGADPGDPIRFQINGIDVIPNGANIWTQNGDEFEVCLSGGGTLTQSCDLFAGWNLVSWHYDTPTDAVETVLNSLAGCVDVVLGFEQGGLAWDPDLPDFSTLKTVDHLSGYWIKLNCDATMDIAGLPVPVTTPIGLTPGWNLVSYLPSDMIPVQEATASVGADLLVALGQSEVYVPGQEPFNTLDTMNACSGYWLKTADYSQLIYPGTGPVLPVNDHNAGTGLLAAGESDLIPTTSWINVYSRNLRVDGNRIKAGATISAHSFSGQVVGSFRMSEDGRFGFMPVYADDPTTDAADGVIPNETFRISVDGVQTNEQFTWTQTGDRVEITSLSTGGDNDGELPRTYGLNQNYPNPFNPTTTISFSLPASGFAKIEIYNILGELVAIPFDGPASAGDNSVIWDGRNSTGSAVSSGVYFYRLTSGDYSSTKKMMMLK